jgi:hypothetical protein
MWQRSSGRGLETDSRLKLMCRKIVNTLAWRGMRWLGRVLHSLTESGVQGLPCSDYTIDTLMMATYKQPICDQLTGRGIPRGFVFGDLRRELLKA